MKSGVMLGITLEVLKSKGQRIKNQES